MILTYWLTVWLSDCLTDLTIWLSECLTVCLTVWLTQLACLLTDWLTDGLTDWRTDKLTDGLTDGLTDWLTDSLTHWLTDLMTDMTCLHTYSSLFCSKHLYSSTPILVLWSHLMRLCGRTLGIWKQWTCIHNGWILPQLAPWSGELEDDLRLTILCLCAGTVL